MKLKLSTFMKAPRYLWTKTLVRNLINTPELSLLLLPLKNSWFCNKGRELSDN